MKYDFVEIGTSDFGTLLQTHNNQIGLSIEPLKIYLDNLPNKDNVTKVNCAVSDKDGMVSIFWIDPSDIEKYNLPHWLKGCNSIQKPHPTAINHLKKQNLEHIYKQTECECLTWSTIIDRYDIDYVEYLKIDTEGHDCVIINNILDVNSVLPKKILFESNVLTSSDTINVTIHRLKQNGYIIIKSGPDDTLVEML